MINCPYCGKKMLRPIGGGVPQPSLVLTKDHIFPREWGGTLYPENTRFVCKRCNGLRAATGHCVGALACLRDISRKTKQDEVMILRRWDLPQPIPPSARERLAFDLEMQNRAKAQRFNSPFEHLLVARR